MAAEPSPSRNTANRASTSPVATVGERAGAVRAGAAPARTGEATDEELFRRGDRESLDQLVRRYESPLYSLLLHLTRGDRHLAEDLFQETFLHAVRAAKTFDATKSLRTWVTAIALNLVRDEARKRKSRGEVLLEGTNWGEEYRPQPRTSGDPPAEVREEARRVRSALAQLTEKEREIVLLHFYQGLTLAEAADALEAPIGTMKSRLHSALSRLRDLLGA
jgi:RNA polymerase sigma-70 factor (ECF subfamily)